ncbi:hypothetical protein BSL78_10147 [Apostichopus japonicus]|uniref:Uncharacterized protein n=1 Tax=Stichopus japonicus TaxID=307972 RepID=A0A2G8KY55_STIJA|nr:hypothetical protein BSL78_10147 [Apostichopus japonicus]
MVVSNTSVTPHSKLGQITGMRRFFVRKSSMPLNLSSLKYIYVSCHVFNVLYHVSANTAHFSVHPKELYNYTDVFASSRTGTQSIISATQIHSSTQPSEGSPKVSSSTQDSSSSSETTGSRNVGLSPHLPSKNSEVFSHETEARNFSTVTAQKIETDRPTWSSTAIKRDCKSEVQTKIHVENSDPLCNTAENTSSIKESIIKMSKKSKDDVKSDIKSLKIPKSSIKESIKKTSKKTKDYVKSDIKSLKIPKQKKIEKSSNNQSVLANTLSKKSPSKEKSSTAKTSTQSSK